MNAKQVLYVGLAVAVVVVAVGYVGDKAAGKVADLGSWLSDSLDPTSDNNIFFRFAMRVWEILTVEIYEPPHNSAVAPSTLPPAYVNQPGGGASGRSNPLPSGADVQNQYLGQ
jgi:hypothetical protein